MTKSEVENLKERLNRLARSGYSADGLTTEEANMVRYFWIRLNWTQEEEDEHHRCREQMDAIHDAAGSVYLNAEQNREYMKLSARATQVARDIGMKRVCANDAMRDRVWPELAPRVLRYWKLLENGKRRIAELNADEAEELKVGGASGL